MTKKTLKEHHKCSNTEYSSLIRYYTMSVVAHLIKHRRTIRNFQFAVSWSKREIESKDTILQRNVVKYNIILFATSEYHHCVDKW